MDLGPDTRFFHVFYALQILGGVLFISMMLLAIISRSIYRHASWYSFCVAWILYSFSYSLLAFTGRPQSAQSGLCTFQTALIYSASPIAGSATLAIVLHLLYEILSTIYAHIYNDGTSRAFIFSLIFVPWATWAAMFFGVLGTALRDPSAILLEDNAAYCSLKNPTISRVPSIWSLITTTLITVSAVTICIVVYRNRGRKLKMDSALSMTIRVVLFTLLGLAAIITSFVFTFSETRRNEYEAMLAIVTPITALIFGTQSDFLRLLFPYTMAAWPWSRRINPFYQEVKAESSAWIHSFHPFEEESQRAFEACDFKHLRTGADLMNLFFVIDEYTDNAEIKTVSEILNIVIDALYHPHTPRPTYEIFFGEATRQFWSLASQTATPTAQRHFIRYFTQYLRSVMEQANARGGSHSYDVESYIKTRRDNIGLRPSCTIGELGLNLPDQVVYHSAIEGLLDCIAELVFIDNDMVSYNREQATGNDMHNIITIAMHQYRFTSPNQAMVWAAQYHKSVEARFLAGLQRIPSFGSETLDREVQQYLECLANWPRANDCWNFECGRYFGKKGLQVRQTRWVELLPKEDKNDIGNRCDSASERPVVYRIST
ncbi:hypothetical protein AX16_009784 [Volvariella volvacea WC 439]|nr:hypothetical protein AX16_009784 [Volvariella volvacea WC 439]